MPIENIIQPEMISIDKRLRLRKYDHSFSFALEWYQVEHTVKLVDGLHGSRYDFAKLKRMYEYLNSIGELYFIEVLENGEFIPIGDVTFWQDDMPIVIGNEKYRGKGIGKQVVIALMERARQLGFQELSIHEIYTYNKASQHLFESVGFTKSSPTKNGYSYRVEL